MEQFFIILLASIIWTVSPIGVMFWLAMAVQFSRKPDSILTVIARIVQGLALTIWFLTMLILLLFYLDALYKNIFRMPADILGTLITGGFAFAIVMAGMVFIEKTWQGNSRKSIKSIKSIKSVK